MLDLLELYTHSRTATSVGADFPTDEFLTIRIPLNQEADQKKLPRFAHWKKGRPSDGPGARPANGSKDHKEVAPANPIAPVSVTGERRKKGEHSHDTTIRFMLNPEQANAEKAVVSEYFKVEMEEYEVDE